MSLPYLASGFDAPDKQGDWRNRIGQIDKSDKETVEERLKYLLDIPQNPSDDWFRKNASPELLKKIYDDLTEDDKQSVKDSLIDR